MSVKYSLMPKKIDRKKKRERRELRKQQCYHIFCIKDGSNTNALETGINRTPYKNENIMGK